MYDKTNERLFCLFFACWYLFYTRYKNYNLRGGKVVYLTDYRGDSPYLYHKSHKIKYFKEAKYKEPKYEKREENREERREENENGNGREHGKGKGHKK